MTLEHRETEVELSKTSSQIFLRLIFFIYFPILNLLQLTGECDIEFRIFVVFRYCILSSGDM